MVVAPVDLMLLLAPLLWAPQQAKAIVGMAVLSLVLLNYGGRHRARLYVSLLDDLPSLLGKLLTAAAVVATVIALRHEQDSVMQFLINSAAAIGLVVAGRGLTAELTLLSRRRLIARHRTVLIGGGQVAADLARVLEENARYGLEVVGFVDGEPDRPVAVRVPYLGRLADLDDAIVDHDVRVLLVADGDQPDAELLDAVRSPAGARCDLLVLPRLHHFHTQTGMADHIGSIPIMRIRTPSLEGPAYAVKRCFDILVAGSALVLISPVMAVCALAVRLEGGPGVIFRQRRIGRDGVEFDCLKLRSMRPTTGAESATNWSIAHDNRVGPVGRILRRTSLDELPQLWNIVRGDMTLVGPRPERPHFVSIFSVEYFRYDQRHRMRAGLTGLAQVSGLRGDTSIADRARYDNYYIENWSLWLDVKILLRTFGEVLFARGR
jgi:exopolysaccharide biosynthesis polyprenyl glycosylphosphotransferase